MYITFFEDKIFSISGVFNQPLFFANLPKLIQNEEYILGLASFMPNEVIGTKLQKFPSLSIPGKYNFRFLTRRNSETAWGGAYYVQASAHNLDQLVSMAKSVESPELFCSHVIGFSKEGPLISFHDAFEGPDMFVSSRISTLRVEAFCSALGVKHSLIANPVSLEGRTSGLGIPKSELDYRESNLKHQK